MREAADRRRNGEGGFTLIELLVVVVILVALAAIAIPVFLNQKSKADNASAQTLTSNVANAVASGIGTDSLNPAVDADNKVTDTEITTAAGTQALGDAVVYYNATTDAFCVSVPGAGSTPFWKYTSAEPDVVSGAACTTPAG